jgi:hypothetical protein
MALALVLDVVQVLALVQAQARVLVLDVVQVLALVLDVVQVQVVYVVYDLERVATATRAKAQVLEQLE